MIDLSVIIITKNEEKRLLSCLSSLPVGAELIVVDSGSSDATVEMAKGAGALVIHREFDGYASQKNAAMNLASRTWILSMDADEVLSPGLSQTINDRIAGVNNHEADESCFRLVRRLEFMGRTMRFGKTSDAPTRLFRRGSGEFVGQIHEKFVPTSGRSAPILRSSRADFILHTSYQDLSDYFEKMNRYTSRMASSRTELVHGPLAVLRFCLRPIFEFIARYFLRLGFLDGYPGYCYALTSAVYSFVKYAKARELLNR